MGWLEFKGNSWLYEIFRIGFGALFLMHGMQKMFTIWGMPPGMLQVGNLVWFAGIFEMMIGLALVFGVLTRLASGFGVIMMLVAFMMGHVMPNAWNFNPMTNMGEPALIFALAFLVTFVYGAGKLSLERAVLKKELF